MDRLRLWGYSNKGSSAAMGKREELLLFAVLTHPRGLISNYTYNSNRYKIEIQKTAGRPLTISILINVHSSVINSYGLPTVLLSMV